jgi:hypothetical protein
MKLPLDFEMTTSRADFRRLLPAAVGHVPFTEIGNEFCWREMQADGCARAWKIELTPIPELRLGSIALERHRVRFSFEGFSAVERAAFMARFEVYFRRGGG